MLSNRDRRLIIIIVIREDDYNRVIVKPTISKTIAAINTVQINDNVTDRKQLPKCNLYNDRSWILAAQRRVYCNNIFVVLNPKRFDYHILYIYRRFLFSLGNIYNPTYNNSELSLRSITPFLVMIYTAGDDGVVGAKF